MGFVHSLQNSKRREQLEIWVRPPPSCAPGGSPFPLHFSQDHPKALSQGKAGRGVTVGDKPGSPESSQGQTGAES